MDFSKEKGGESRLRVMVRRKDIPWAAISDALSENMKRDKGASVKVLKNFVRSLSSPVSLHWLGGRTLSSDELEVARTLCEYYSADILCIFGESVIHMPLLEPTYRAEITLEPFYRDPGSDERKGRATGRYGITLFGRHLAITSLFRALVFYMLLILIGALIYVVLVGFLLYSLAVFISFINEPGAIAAAAMHRPSIGLALLCFLTALAGLSGEAIRKFVAFVRNKVRFKHRRLK